MFAATLGNQNPTELLLCVLIALPEMVRPEMYPQHHIWATALETLCRQRGETASQGATACMEEITP